MKPSTLMTSACCLFALCTSAPAAEKPYQTLYKQGVAANQKGNLTEAIRLYGKAIAIKKDSPELYFVRGRAYREAKQLDNAIRDFDQAVRLKPSYAEAYNNRGITWIGKGDPRKASADFKKACDLGFSDGCRNLKMLSPVK